MHLVTSWMGIKKKKKGNQTTNLKKRKKDVSCFQWLETVDSNSHNRGSAWIVQALV